MNKHDMIEEIIEKRPIELLLNSLWEDTVIISSLRKKLQAISKTNLIPYHKQFIDRPILDHKTKAEHIPLFKKNYEVNKYFKNLHGVI